MNERVNVKSVRLKPESTKWIWYDGNIIRKVYIKLISLKLIRILRWGYTGFPRHWKQPAHG